MPLHAAVTPRGVAESIVRALESRESAKLDKDPPLTNQEILITFQGGRSVFEGFDDLRQRFMSALIGAARQEWKIIQLFGLDGDATRALELVQTMVPLLRVPNAYEAHYFWPNRSLTPPYDLVILPDKAFVVFATTESLRVGGGFWVSGTESEILRDHFNLLRTHTNPLLEYFTHDPQDRQRWEQKIVAIESLPGERLLVQDGPTTLSYPSHWLAPDTHWAEAQLRTGIDNLDAAIDEHRKRARLFAEQVRQFRYLSICPKSAVERLVTQGVSINRPPYKHFIESPEERVEHLNNLISLLRTYDNFELALADEAEERFVDFQFFEEIKGDFGVLMELFPVEHRHEHRIGAFINEPSIVAAMQRDFHNTWQRLSAISRNKEYVILWLERQRDLASIL